MHKVSIVGLAAAVITGVVVAASTLMSGTGSAGAVAKGADAGQGQFPYSVKLTMTNIPKPDGSTYDSACSAGLVNPRYIVTAGHCFHDVNRNPVSGKPQYKTTATIGVANIDNGGGTTVDVVDVQQSPSNDIAVAKLSRPVPASKYLHIGQTKPTAGQELVIAGWGATDSTNPAPSHQLRYGKFQVSSVADTTLLLHGVWPEADTSACLYDSGAPYFSLPETGDATLVAVESNGPDCPHTTDETTSRVDVIADWINRQIR